MSRSTRRQRSESQLRTLEQQFSTDLITALRDCVAGKWGMFGQNDEALESEKRLLRERLKSTVAENLIAQGKAKRSCGCGENSDTLTVLPCSSATWSIGRCGRQRTGKTKLAVEFLRELEQG